MKKAFFSLILLCSSLFADEAFDWSRVLEIPPGTKDAVGNQILHFKSTNKNYRDDEKSLEFVKKCLIGAKELFSDAEVLHYGSDQVTIDGFFLEMGVCTGKTINFIAALNPHQTIYGFDSFQGLPEDWIREDQVIAKGTFAFKNADLLPPVLHNVCLYKGWFADSLPKFKKEVLKEKPIAFLFIDCDIYSSTKDVFEILGDNIQEGTVIVFDEFYNYPGYKNHEFKAFGEFLNKKNYFFEFLAYNAFHEQVAVRIKKP